MELKKIHMDTASTSSCTQYLNGSTEFNKLLKLLSFQEISNLKFGQYFLER